MISSILDDGISWFPQEYASAFFLIKGFLGLISTLLLIYHMLHTWQFIPALGQRLRYITLLGFSVLVTGSTAEQVQQETLVNYRNIGTVVVLTLLIIAMVVSIREDLRRAK